ncbi:antitoxin [Streptomyces sp. NPDC090108]|uniref:antitoxin n=1 Tax=Streptomyces sp. NPDC090108 TaxID=3365947 RepID=UPI0038162137
MGLLDNMKDKMSDLARQHGDKVQHGIDKAAQAVDERTKGKYSEKIHAGTDKAKDAMDRLAHMEATHPGQTAHTPHATHPSEAHAEQVQNGDMTTRSAHPKTGAGDFQRDASHPDVIPPENPPPAS